MLHDVHGARNGVFCYSRKPRQTRRLASGTAMEDPSSNADDHSEFEPESDFGRLHRRRDLFYLLAKDLLDRGFWDRELPKHERNIVEAATRSHKAWQQFFDHHGGEETGAERKANLASQSKSKRGTSKRAKSAQTTKKRAPSTKKLHASNEDADETEVTNHLDVLANRVRAYLMDAAVDELMFASTKHNIQSFPSEYFGGSGAYLHPLFPASSFALLCSPPA
jgi:hypothetical protein